MNDENDNPVTTEPPDGKTKAGNIQTDKSAKPETGGPKGPDPTRYGDWEKKGRCIDF